MLNKTGIVFFITLMFIAGIIVPVVSAVESNVNNRDVLDASIISMNITSPTEGEVGYTDIVGGPATSFVEVSSIHGIKEVLISNEKNQSVCQNDFGNRYVCEISSWKIGKNSVTITATDNSGKTISKTRNFSIVGGQMPPPKVTPSPINTQLPGFSFSMGIIGLVIGLIVLFIKNR